MAMSEFVLRGHSVIKDSVLGLLLSAVVAGALATMLEFLRLRDAWPWVLTGWNVLSVGALFLLPYHARNESERKADAVLGKAAAIGFVFAVVVILTPLLRPWIGERADSWFHAAVVAEIERGGFPPEDPYFAGFRLQYMWFYHMIVTAVVRTTGMSAFHLMPILNGVAILCVCVFSADVLLALGRDRRAAVWGSVIVPLALSALFWVFFPVRLLKAFLGRSGGVAEAAHEFRLAPLDIPTTRLFLSDFDSVPFFLNKFLTGTAYGLALAFLLLYLAAILRFADDRTTRHLILAGTCLFFMLLLHPVVGITAIAVSGISGLFLAALGPSRGGLSWSPVVRWGAVVLVAAAAAVPYLRLVTAGKPQDQLVPFHFSPWVVVGIAIGCFFVLLAGAGPLRRLWRESRPEGRLFVLWTLATIVFGLVIRLPGPNTTDKFTYLIYLPLALAAAVWASERWRGRRGLLVALLVLVPVNLIGYSGYWGDPDRRESASGGAAIYQWIAANTPRDAIIVENRERVGVLVEGPRRLFWGRESYAQQWGYDPARVIPRRDATAALYDPLYPIDEDTIRALKEISAPVYVVVRAEDFASPDDFAKLDRYPQWFTRAHEADGVRIYRLVA
jgi:hypothetical protein